MILGMDLGSNSIGWTLTDSTNNGIVKAGVFTIPNFDNINSKSKSRTILRRNRRLQQKQALINGFNRKLKSKKITEVENIALNYEYLTNNWKQIVLYTISITLGFLSIFQIGDWQFWLNLSIGCLIASISLTADKK